MLTKKNKRMVRKMKKYIKTFPLTEKEIDQMIEDITGMAEEAQERNENFETVLGKSVHEFCDDLIYSVGGIRAPGGRKLIRGTSIYFQLLGLWGIVGCLINVCFLAGERVHALWMLAISIGIWYLGHYGEAIETKLLLRRIDGAIRVRSNVDPTFDSLVGSGRSGGDHHGSSLLENPYIPYQCMDSYLSSTGLGSASMGK